jgi:hypothetical protein
MQRIAIFILKFHKPQIKRPKTRDRGDSGGSEYCSARQKVQSQLAKHSFRLDSQHGGELENALPVEITGMAFEDFERNRGSAQVATVWELHPAILNIGFS